MGQYTSYWLYQKYETRGSQDPIPCYPNVYSVDGDGTMSLVVRKEDDTQCGYVPPVEPVYRWVNIPITQDYVCDDCNNVEYRWINMNVNTDYYCEGTTKYYKQKKQQSSDGGQTWSDVVPAEYRKGGVAETESTDCGYVPPVTQYRWVKTNDTTCIEEGPEVQYRWVNMDVSVDYYCEGTTKYYKQKKQVSYDGGQTWQDVSPAEYQKGGVAETESFDCGYVPPIPTNKKLVAAYTEGTTNEVECNDSTELTSGETKPSGYQASAMTSAAIGDCTTRIGRGAFKSCTGLKSVAISNSVTSIGQDVFYLCTGLKSVTIPNSVTSIEAMAFNQCSGLTNINLSNNLTGITDSVFAHCSGLTSVTIPDSAKYVSYDAFYKCISLTSVTIPNSVTSIGDGAFSSCSGLTSITIPSGVTYIGDNAFSSCSGLLSVTVNATTPPTLRYGVFYSTNNCPIYVPAASVNAYKSATNWSEYASRIQPIP